MEPLEPHQQELDFRRTPDGLEVQFVYDSLLSMAYTKVEDPKNHDKFMALVSDADIAKGKGAVESFRHPFIYRIGQAASQEVVRYEAEDGRASE